ncbi:UNVERIFIED_CONTAM: hypothetical protein Sradi_1373300 [Sesamum radiatum]|uniref:Uncharacterized protein n=1 Tax=Sesamum radiatum TaxID=300843 RepID=A0AAW2USX1_SESRA
MTAKGHCIPEVLGSTSPDESEKLLTDDDAKEAVPAEVLGSTSPDKSGKLLTDEDAKETVRAEVPISTAETGVAEPDINQVKDEIPGAQESNDAIKTNDLDSKSESPEHGGLLDESANSGEA